MADYKPSTQVRLPTETRGGLFTAFFAIQWTVMMVVAAGFSGHATSALDKLVVGYTTMGHDVSTYNTISTSLLSATLACVLALMLALLGSQQAKVTCGVIWAVPLGMRTWQTDTWPSGFATFVAASTLQMLLGGRCLTCGERVRSHLSRVSVSLQAMQFHPWLLRQSLGLVFLQALFYLSWAVGALGVYQWWDQQELVCHVSSRGNFSTLVAEPSGTMEMCALAQHESTARSMGSALLLAVSLFWTWQAFRGALHATIASTIAKWWSGSTGVPTTLQEALPVSWERLLCESLEVPLSMALRPTLVAHGKRRSVLSSSTRHNMSFLDKWSFVHLGIFGGDCSSASQQASELIDSRGWRQVLEDRSLGHLFWSCNLAIAAYSAILAWSVGSLTSWQSIPSAFVFGWVGGSTLLTVSQAATQSLVVAAAGHQPKNDLQKTVIFYQLTKGWDNIYPGALAGTR